MFFYFIFCALRCVYGQEVGADKKKMKQVDEDWKKKWTFASAGGVDGERSAR